MNPAPGVHGLEEVLSNLNEKIREVKRFTVAGLIRAAIIVRRDMDKCEPKIPVDTGKLRQSWFLNTFSKGRKPVVQFGFNASYAWYVHEMVGATFKRPGAGAKFLEAALKRNEREMLAVIREEARGGL